MKPRGISPRWIVYGLPGGSLTTARADEGRPYGYGPESAVALLTFRAPDGRYGPVKHRRVGEAYDWVLRNFNI